MRWHSATSVTNHILDLVCTTSIFFVRHWKWINSTRKLKFPSLWTAVNVGTSQIFKWKRIKKRKYAISFWRINVFHFSCNILLAWMYLPSRFFVSFYYYYFQQYTIVLKEAVKLQTHFVLFGLVLLIFLFELQYWIGLNRFSQCSLGFKFSCIGSELRFITSLILQSTMRSPVKIQRS